MFFEEIRNLEQLGILEETKDITEWVNSFVIVEKKLPIDSSNTHSPEHVVQKKLRICLGPRDLNEALECEPYYTHSIEEIIGKFDGMTKFTIADFNKIYWMVELDPELRKYTTKALDIGSIAGRDNILADTLSSLIDIDPDAVLEPELKDYEFGCYAFETLPKAKSKSAGEKLALVDGVDMCEINLMYDNSENSKFSVKLPLSNEQFTSLQENDEKIHALKEKVMDGLYSDCYFIHKSILYRSVIDNGHKFRAAVVPEELVGTVLYLKHN